MAKKENNGMTVKECCEQIKKQKELNGWSDDDTLSFIFTLFQREFIDFKALESITGYFGYGLNPEFVKEYKASMKKKGE